MGPAETSPPATPQGASVGGSEAAAPAPAVRRRSFRSNLAHTSVANLVIGLVNIATGLLVARLLGAEGRGELAAIFNWPLLLAGLATLGLPDALVYFAARHPERSSRYLATGISITLVSSLAFMAVGWVAMPFLLSAQSAEVITAARWYLLSVPVAAVYGLTARPLRGIGDFRTWNYLRTAPTVLWLAVILGFMVVGNDSPTDLAIVYVFTRLALIPLALIVERRKVGGRLRPDRHEVRPLLRYGIPSLFAVLPALVNLRLDQLVMAAFLGPADLGLYVVAVTWSNMSGPVLTAFGNVVFPWVTWEADQPEKQAQTYAQASRVAFLLSIALGLVLLPVTPVAIRLLFGSEYADSVPAGMVLVVAAIPLGVRTVLQEGLRGLGRPTLVMWSELVAVAVTVAGVALLLKPFGIVGAAVASLLSYLTVTVQLVVQSARVTKLRSADFVLPRRSDLTAIWAQVPNRLKPARFRG